MALNLGIMTRQAIRRRSCTSVGELTAKIRRFIDGSPTLYIQETLIKGKLVEPEQLLGVAPADRGSLFGGHAGAVERVDEHLQPAWDVRVVGAEDELAVVEGVEGGAQRGQVSRDGVEHQAPDDLGRLAGDVCPRLGELAGVVVEAAHDERRRAAEVGEDPADAREPVEASRVDPCDQSRWWS